MGQNIEKNTGLPDDLYVDGSDIPGTNNPSARAEIHNRKILFEKHAEFISNLDATYVIFGGDMNGRIGNSLPACEEEFITGDEHFGALKRYTTYNTINSNGKQ